MGWKRLFHNSTVRWLKHLFLKPTLPDRRGWDRHGSLRDVQAEPHTGAAALVVVAHAVHVASSEVQKGGIYTPAETAYPYRSHNV